MLTKSDTPSSIVPCPLQIAPIKHGPEGSLVRSLLKATGEPLVQTRFTILTVLPTRGHRDTVERLCTALAPGCAIVHVPSATDAVLTLLSEPIDLLIVDACLAGDLLATLKRHARRSAPHAITAIFRTDADASQEGNTQDTDGLPWSALEARLRNLLPGA